MRYVRYFPAASIQPVRTDEEVGQSLITNGIAFIDNGTPLSNEDYLMLMKKLGDPIPEEDSEISNFVEQGVILNVRTSFEECLNASVQPFATNGLTFHMERAFSTADKQPNYLALMCVEPPNESVGGTDYRI